MENSKHKALHDYTQRVYEARGYVSEVTGEDVELSVSAKIVYLYLLGNMFDLEDEFVISQSDLGCRLGFDTKTTAKALSGMLEHGAIFGEKKKNESGGFSQWYYTEVAFPLKLTKNDIARKKSTRKVISNSVRFEVFRRSKFCCSYCGKAAAEGNKLQIDHIKSVSKGGTNDIDNLTASCYDCNNGKGTADVDSYTPPVFP